MRVEYQVVAAFGVDLLFGDPRWLPHPIKWIGRFAAALEAPLRRAIPNARAAGIVAVFAVLTVTGLAAFLLVAGAASLHPIAADVVSIALLYTCFAGRDLALHSARVYRALANDDLPEARRRVAMLVGRDTEYLDEPEVVRGTVESVAENMVDGVTAPLFFAVLGGPVGALLCGGEAPETVEISLPDGSRVRFPVVACRLDGQTTEASVCKDAGDDPDITHQATVMAAVSFAEGDGVHFAAGEGVGTVTKPGISVAPGEPAINPALRQMIRQAVHEVTARGVNVTVSIPGGRELAARTFNPRLGIEGGLSIIGTTGIVKPFSAPALTAALKCALDVAAACGVRAPVLVPGNIGERAALKNLRVSPDRVIQVSNHWGFMLDQVSQMAFERLLVLGHPGKLAKLIDGEWDTHSSNSASVVGIVARLAKETLGVPVPESTTVEGIFEALNPEKTAQVGNALAAAIKGAIIARIGSTKALAVVLINMPGDFLGTNGDLSPWK